MDKHAYLIIAHNEFKILELLVNSLDDPRNDIFIHFDAKCIELPDLQCRAAGLYILTDRIDARWGDFGIVETEMLLLKTAYNVQHSKSIKYLYYHLLSGVDFPLKSQDYIHNFFRKNQGKEFLGYFQGEVESELRNKVQMYHLFPKSFSKERVLNLKSLSRTLFCRIQQFLGIKRNNDIILMRGTEWASITNDFVAFLLSKKDEIQKRFHHTFCADEIYKHTLCWNSSFKNNIYNSQNEALGCMREINWVITDKKSFLPSFTMDDYERLKNSPMLFARKFDSANINIVKKIISEL